MSINQKDFDAVRKRIKFNKFKRKNFFFEPLLNNRYQIIINEKSSLNFFNKSGIKNLQFPENAYIASSHIHISSGNCNVTYKDLPYSTRTDGVLIKQDKEVRRPLILRCHGTGEHNIEMIGIDYLSAMINSQVKSYNLSFEGLYSFAGTITVENFSYNVKQTTFLLKNGILLTGVYLRDYISDSKTLEEGKALLEKAYQEFDEIYNHGNNNYWYERKVAKNINTKGMVLLKEKLFRYMEEIIAFYEKDFSQLEDDSLAIDSSKASKSATQQREESKVEKKQLEVNDFAPIINDFKSYQTDLIKMMTYPVLSDLNDSNVKAFNTLCRKINQGKLEYDIDDFISEWEGLKSYASTVLLSKYDNSQRKDIKDAKTMLAKALDAESTDNEKSTSIKGLVKTLEGTLPINDSVINWLKQESGLKEISI